MAFVHICGLFMQFYGKVKIFVDPIFTLCFYNDKTLCRGRTKVRQ